MSLTIADWHEGLWVKPMRNFRVKVFMFREIYLALSHSNSPKILATSKKAGLEPPSKTSQAENLWYFWGSLGYQGFLSTPKQTGAFSEVFSTSRAKAAAGERLAKLIALRGVPRCKKTSKIAVSLYGGHVAKGITHGCLLSVWLFDKVFPLHLLHVIHTYSYYICYHVMMCNLDDSKEDQFWSPGMHPLPRQGLRSLQSHVFTSRSLVPIAS